jgi:hypothetical protein
MLLAFFGLQKGNKRLQLCVESSSNVAAFCCLFSYLELTDDFLGHFGIVLLLVVVTHVVNPRVVDPAAPRVEAVDVASVIVHAHIHVEIVHMGQLSSLPEGRCRGHRRPHPRHGHASHPRGR